MIIAVFATLIFALIAFIFAIASYFSASSGPGEKALEKKLKKVRQIYFEQYFPAKGVEGREKRKYGRHLRNFSLAVDSGSGKSRGIGKVKDISFGGSSFVTDANVKEGMRINLSFVPPGVVSHHFFDFKIKVPATVRRVSPKPDGTKGVAIEFQPNLKEFINKRIYRPIRRNSSILFILILLNIFFIKSWNVRYFWHSIPINTYSLVVAAYILSRFLFALFYLPSKDNKHMPSVSMIIPAKNEEKVIKTTIEHAYNVKYPKDKYEVIFINDNSSDNTLEQVYRLQKKFKDLIILDLTGDEGKRAAMAAGFYKSKGEIVIVIDSDSFITRDSVYNIVQDFTEPKVAAVSGHTDVYNSKDNKLTRMQTVRYFLSFRVMKAAEGIFSNVTCCPGCFTAYRRSNIMEIVEQWKEQRFLGRRCTFGDDRSLTMMLLRHYMVKYNSNALAYTVVPKSYGHFLKQQLRWKKSWLRENLLGCTFMWKKHPLMVFSFYAGLIMPLISPVVAFMSIVYRPIILGQPFYVYLSGALLVSLIYSLYFRLARPSRMWIYGVYFCFFYLFVLAWQNYIALLTLRHTGWGTRGGNAKRRKV